MASYEVYLRKFRIPLGILAATLVLSAVLLMQTVPKIQKIAKIQKNTRTQATSLADMERRLEVLKKNEESKDDENLLMKQFFKPINGGTDTESVIADEFAEILELMRDNKIKTRSIKYDYDPQDDNFVKFAANRYHVCRVTAEMIGNYANFENFLRDLYKHEHYLEMSKIEIIPYQKNKKILLATVEIKLYAQRDPSTIVEEPAPVNNSQTEDGMYSPDASMSNPNMPVNQGIPNSPNNSINTDEF